MHLTQIDILLSMNYVKLCKTGVSYAKLAVFDICCIVIKYA